MHHERQDDRDIPAGRRYPAARWSRGGGRARDAALERTIVVCVMRNEGDGGNVEAGGEVTGVVMLHMLPSQATSFRAWVEKLLVAPARRRIGVAGAMMRMLEEVARERGKTMLVGPVCALLDWAGFPFGFSLELWWYSGRL
jgi:GNAT superfamily N-acetyltransferase